jgi:hypothetical protein
MGLNPGDQTVGLSLDVGSAFRWLNRVFLGIRPGVFARVTGTLSRFGRMLVVNGLVAAIVAFNVPARIVSGLIGHHRLSLPCLIARSGNDARPSTTFWQEQCRWMWRENDPRGSGHGGDEQTVQNLEQEQRDDRRDIDHAE